VNIVAAKISANVIRLLYKIKLISLSTANKKINELTIRVLQEEIDRGSESKEK
jgi:hypothetical protein